jgi:hypothetical protein
MAEASASFREAEHQGWSAQDITSGTTTISLL